MSKKILIIFLAIVGLIVIGNLSVPRQWQIGLSDDQQNIASLKKFDLETVRLIKQRYRFLLFLISRELPACKGGDVSKVQRLPI